jgi:hypothetical protein
MPPRWRNEARPAMILVQPTDTPVSIFAVGAERPGHCELECVLVAGPDLLFAIFFQVSLELFDDGVQHCSLRNELVREGRDVAVVEIRCTSPFLSE